MRFLALILAALPVGHSVDGRAIRPVVLGTPGAAHRLLVVGCIHGTEPAGVAIVRRLIRVGAPAGTEIVALPALNPDGCAHGTRGNADGVDLNRNFGSLTEPESRYAVALLRVLRPDVTVWFHQHEGFVRAWGPSVPTARRFAALAAYPYRTVEWPAGSATRWQNRHQPGTAAFVVELPAGSVPAARVRAWVRALRKLAVEGVRR